METPGEQLAAILRRHPPYPLVPASLLDTDPVVLDLTGANPDLSAVDLSDASAFQAYVQNELAASGARVALGRYDEDRVVYRHSPLFGEGDDARRVHLGVDLFVPAGTPLAAPHEGVVHSVADNARLGDYGPTILLEHVLEGVVFHTLYGHLSRASIQALAPGQRVDRGRVFAEVGSQEVNGGWPPHVHVQIIARIGTARGDFPGVATRRERERMLGNCPDASLLLTQRARA